MTPKLQPEDMRRLEAAEGWLMLGNHLEADAELEGITAGCRAHPDVLKVRWQVLARAEKWELAYEVASALVTLVPDGPEGWLHRSYSARRMLGGGLQRAYDELFPAYEKFPTEPIVPFNLACYSCQLGRLEAAKDWLHKAYAIGNARKIELMALDDPDLQPLWQSGGPT
jgi:Flp pilus assembly protein TadD